MVPEPTTKFRILNSEEVAVEFQSSRGTITVVVRLSDIDVIGDDLTGSQRFEAFEKARDVVEDFLARGGP